MWFQNWRNDLEESSRSRSDVQEFGHLLNSKSPYRTILSALTKMFAGWISSPKRSNIIRLSLALRRISLDASSRCNACVLTNYTVDWRTPRLFSPWLLCCTWSSVWSSAPDLPLQPVPKRIHFAFFESNNEWLSEKCPCPSLWSLWHRSFARSAKDADDFHEHRDRSLDFLQRHLSTITVILGGIDDAEMTMSEFFRELEVSQWFVRIGQLLSREEQ